MLYRVEELAYENHVTQTRHTKSETEQGIFQDDTRYKLGHRKYASKYILH